jgi:aspartyl-tRNA(Asn)/glutamyl-tRNA(Gln) amidotransferase subunit C
MSDRKVTLEEVRHVAALARLELAPEELERMRDVLSAIIAHVAELEAFDVEGVLPTFYPVEIQAVLREDEITASLDRDEVLSGAPKSEAGGFAVPRVMDGDG